MSYPTQQFSTTPPRRLTDDELARRWAESYPEMAGPGVDTESGAVQWGAPAHPRIGPIPHLLDPAIRDRENDERYRRWLAMSEGERALAEAEAIRARTGR